MALPKAIADELEKSLTRVNVLCDGCGKREHVLRVTMDTQLTILGWTLKGGLYHCKECS